ncbi:MAG: D-alanyl-D-alanine carboxypeptidase [Clostridiales bacterium]|nr:D-alanyl-D-alanine carboxypeptidase [Clostridiales bacterium]
MKFRGAAQALLFGFFMIVNGCGAIPAVFASVNVIDASMPFTAEETADDSDGDKSPGNLYALSAVLMDGDSGRVLYEKEGETARANASTTKVLTCILALENAPGDDYVIVSANAAAQPEVRLGLQEGEQYYLEDLLYSMMLGSHNDSAMAVAEHIGGSEEGFARLMNEKARDLGCEDTHFVTPNGLDGEDEGGEHHTTARDLARIMRYAIQNETFLRITQAASFSFTDLSKKRQFSVQNANALLNMTEGVLSGKTGYTGSAGYCYVCAARRKEKTFVIALLGCGWPSHKTWKWSDAMTLLNYGDENYSYETISLEAPSFSVRVNDGASEGNFGADVFLEGECRIPEEESERALLLRAGETVTFAETVPETVDAPVAKGQTLGTVSWYLGEETLGTYPVRAGTAVPRRTWAWYTDQVFHRFFHD